MLKWLSALLLCLVVCTDPNAFSAPSSRSKPSRHVVLIIWDGMRPDFITEQNCPTLIRLASRGVNFLHHHSTYPSATEVNGTVFGTGCYPEKSGLIANNEYRPAIDLSQPFHTELFKPVRKGDQLSRDHYLKVPTLAQYVRKSGGHTVVAGAKPVAFLADRLEEPRDRAANPVLYAGASLPAPLWQNLTSRLGPFPDDSGQGNSRIDWTTIALIESLWGRQVPEFTLVWMNQPDFWQHQYGPGSPQALAGIRNADQNLGRILDALEAKGVLAETDVIIASDHGCSTISTRVDVADLLNRGGLKASRAFGPKPAKGEILVASNTGSTLLYVAGHDPATISQAIKVLQQSPVAGVIFTKTSLPGTFSLKTVHLDSEDAPDIAVSLRWTTDTNKVGVAGTIVSDLTTYGAGQGAHVSLSPFDMHATLVAAGPHFRRGVTSDLPSGNIDVAPTILHVLGLKVPGAMDGRVLSEALTIKGPNLSSFEPRQIESVAAVGTRSWRQYIRLSEVNGVEYFDEGNGRLQGR